MRFKGSFSHIHRVYLYGFKVILPILLLYLIYSWTFGDSSFTEDMRFFSENFTSFLTPVVILLPLYFLVLFLVGRIYLTINEETISYRQGFWMKRSFSFAEITSIKFVKTTVKGHDMPSIEIITKEKDTYFVNLFSFQKDLQTIVSLFKKGADPAVFEAQFDKKLSSWERNRNFNVNA